MRRAALTAIAVLIALAGLLVAGTAAGDPGDDKQRVDERLGDLRGQLNAAAAKEQVLTSELTAIADRVRAAQSEVESARARLGTLEAELQRQRARLATLDELIRDQTEHLRRLAADQGVAVGRLEERVRELYMSDSPDLLTFLAGAESFSDILDNIELLRRISEQDERIVTKVREIRAQVAEARRATKKSRAEVAVVERQVASRTAEQRTVTDHLVSSRDALVGAQHERENALATIRANEVHLTEEVEALERESVALAETIRKAQAEAAAQAAAAATAQAAATPAPASDDPSGAAPAPEAPVDPAPTPTISGGRLSWPVSGPVVSGFGPRGGRLHEGIDIIVPEGTPVLAAADGIVAYTAWLGGYGNLVVVDHGGGLSTAYAHNSSFASTVGQAVSRGEVVAYSGNTGDSSGPHVHFEVRVGGTAVDPLGYL